MLRPTAVKVVPKDNYILDVEFDNGERKEFDVKVPEPGMENEVTDNLSAFQNPPMTKEERRGIIWLSLKASLTVGLIFGGAAFLFILFCVFVWLK